MLIANLSRKIVVFQTMMLNCTFARNVKKLRQIEDDSDKMPDVISNQGQITRMKWEQKREQNILGLSRRNLREEDQELEREIVRLMDQDKTDLEIV